MPPKPSTRIRRKQFKRPLAKTLRANATQTERRLWAFLRRKQLAQLRFRRQQPIGPYVVDFLCPTAKLIIELDGGQHNEVQNIAHDLARSRWLETHGYRVLRFWNNDLSGNFDAVLEAILNAIKESGMPLPEPPSAVRPSLKGRVKR